MGVLCNGNLQEAVVPGEVPLLLPNPSSWRSSNLLLLEMPPSLDVQGDVGAIGRVVTSKQATQQQQQQQQDGDDDDAGGSCVRLDIKGA